MGWTGTITCTDSCSFDVSGCIPPVASGGDDGGSSNNNDDSSGGGGGGSGSNDDEEIVGFVPFDTVKDSSKTEETGSAAKTQDVLTIDSDNEEERNTLWNMLTGAVVGTNGKVKTSFLLIAIASLGLLAVAFGGLMYCRSKKKK